MGPKEKSQCETLFLFIDESGNFDFSSKGTRHFVMAGVATFAPVTTALPLQALRYQLLTQGNNVQGFHASEDAQSIRDAVFNTVDSALLTAFVVFGDKQNANNDLKSDAALHATFGVQLIESALAHFLGSSYNRIVIVFDQALPKKRQGIFHATMKPLLKKLHKPFHLYFQPMLADMNGQIADYIAWSRFVQLERNEQRPWTHVERNFEVIATDGLVGGRKCDRPD